MDQIIVAVHLGEGRHVDYARGDAIQAFLPESFRNFGRYTRRNYGWVKRTDAACAARLLAKKAAGEPRPVEDYKPDYFVVSEEIPGGGVGDVRVRRSSSAVKFDIDAAPTRDIQDTDDQSKDSPLLDEVDVPMALKQGAVDRG